MTSERAMTHDRTRQVGLVGLGVIGEPIAERLLGHEVALSVHDLNTAPAARLAAAGAATPADLATLAAHCSTVLICVQTDAQCRDVVLGSDATDGLLSHAESGDLIAVLSTVHPRTRSASMAQRTPYEEVQKTVGVP